MRISIYKIKPSDDATILGRPDETMYDDLNRYCNVQSRWTNEGLVVELVTIDSRTFGLDCLLEYCTGKNLALVFN